MPVLVALIAAGASLAGCRSSAATPGDGSAAAAAAYPVTVTNCGTAVTYDRAPRRAVSNDINTTEDMLALGPESRRAGTFEVNGDGPAGQPVPSAYLAGFRRVRDVSSDYFTKEELVGLHPDFLFAGWNHGLEAGSLTPQTLAPFGIKTLALTESCAHVPPGTTSVSISDTYTDLRNLGEIFNVRARAAKVISGMQAWVGAARAKIAGLKPVTVFDYDSGESAPFTGPGLAMPTALAPSPATSPRCATGASSRWPTTRSPPARATPRPRSRSRAGCTPPRSACPPTAHRGSGAASGLTELEYGADYCLCL
jgi:iron complex transport system substrate-binding protein